MALTRRYRTVVAAGALVVVAAFELVPANTALGATSTPILYGAVNTPGVHLLCRRDRQDDQESDGTCQHDGAHTTRSLHDL